MLSRDKRLNLSKEFKWIVSSGKVFDSPSFKIFYKIGHNNSAAKANVALQTKLFKKANLRVKAKRIGFSLIEQIYNKLPKNLNLVMMPKSNFLGKDQIELKKEIANFESILYKFN